MFFQGQTLFWPQALHRPSLGRCGACDFGHISGMVGPIDVKRKGSALVGYWVQYVTLTSLMTLTLDVSRSNFEIALSAELLV